MFLPSNVACDPSVQVLDTSIGNAGANDRSCKRCHEMRLSCVVPIGLQACEGCARRKIKCISRKNGGETATRVISHEGFINKTSRYPSCREKTGRAHRNCGWRYSRAGESRGHNLDTVSATSDEAPSGRGLEVPSTKDRSTLPCRSCAMSDHSKWEKDSFLMISSDGKTGTIWSYSSDGPDGDKRSDVSMTLCRNCSSR